MPQNKINKKILPAAVIIILVAAIFFTLFRNKHTIDEANKPVDRSSVPVSVTIAKVELGDLQVNTKYPAQIKPFDEASVNAQASGLIAYLNVELGQKVNKGQVIGRLDTKILEINLKTAQVSLQTAEVNKRSAQINSNKLLMDYERARDLYENKAGLEVNMINAKNNYDNGLANVDNAANGYNNVLQQINLIKQQIVNSSIIAPLSGTVSAKNVEQGEYVGPGVAIATITNINSLKTTVYVDQELSYQLKSGQVGNISSSVFAEKELLGKIIYISPKADVNHNYQVDLIVTEKNDEGLKAGTDVQVSFNTLNIQKALLIPKSALLTDRQEPFVFVVENGKAKGKEITIGTIVDDKVEVLSGLIDGELVITTGQINIKENSVVAILK